MKKKEEKFKSLFEYYGFSRADEKKHPVISRILKELKPEKNREGIKKTPDFISRSNVIHESEVAILKL